MLSWACKTSGKTWRARSLRLQACLAISTSRSSSSSNRRGSLLSQEMPPCCLLSRATSPALRPGRRPFLADSLMMTLRSMRLLLRSTEQNHRMTTQVKQQQDQQNLLSLWLSTQL